MDQAQTDELRRRLEDELSSIDRQLAEHGVGGDDERIEVAVDEGFADSGQATAGRSELFGLIDQLRSTRTELRDALRKLDQGTYGACEACGRQIPFERLEALPTARLCIACKQAKGAA